MLAAFALGAAASGNRDNPGRAGHEQEAGNPHAGGQGNHSPANGGPDNANSNRQSDPGSTRGLDRAEDRRSAQADGHAQPGKERHWYGFLFGEDGDEHKAKDRGRKEPRWWWPFD